MLIALLLLVLTLFYAAFYDIRTNRIPNWLCLLILCLGIGVNFLPALKSNLLNSLTGMTVGFTLLFLLHLLTGLGAGDVKLMAAIGSVVGVQPILHIFFYSFMISGLFSIGYLAYRGGLRNMMLRYSRLLFSLPQGKVTYERPRTGSSTALQIPLAPGIALATFWEVLPIIQSSLSFNQNFG